MRRALGPSLPVPSPVTWVLVGLAALRVAGIGWGLPGSDGWDNDGVAPRDFLPGLVESFTPGHFYTYPPLHLALLALLTAPITAIGLLRAPGLGPAVLVQHFIQVPYMTAFAYVARAVTVAMSLGMTLALARIAETCWGRRAGLFALLACGLCVPLTYYAHTTCLDVPYLFWASLALLSLVRAVAWSEPRRLRSAMLLAALAVATKDQAYAVFLLAVPAVLVGWLLVARPPTCTARAVVREAAVGAALAAGALVLLDGAVVNPSGFRARVGFLLGSASQDFAQYDTGWAGRVRVVVDAALGFGRAYPWAVASLAALGVILHARAARGPKLVAGLVPLAAALSFTVAFNVAARRVEDRFLLPQVVLIAMYAAAAADRLLADAAARWGRGAFRAASAAGALLCCAAAYRCLEADAALLFDPRYDAEAWMARHVERGETIETYGLNVYLPRFPSFARVVRVGPEPVARRSPQPNMTEVEAPYGHAPEREPRWIVVPGAWVWRYRREGEAPPPTGKIVPPTQERALGDADPVAFFGGLFRGEKGYRLVHESHWTSRLLAPVDINASLACPVYVFERAP
jgi:hypothetical protein